MDTMSDNFILIMATVFICASMVIIIVLNLIQGSKNKKYKKMIDNLEIEKNKLDSSPIAPELTKINAFLNNEKLSAKYDDWKERLEDIKSKQIPGINDMLIDADYSLNRMDYKAAMLKIAKLEMEMYKVKSNSESLLEEIKEITNSEEKNRAVITNLKATYRELYNRFNNSISDFGSAAKYVSFQFENISKRFEVFEKLMDNNDYLEVINVTKSIEEMLEHMKTVLDEVPPIVLIAENILPKRIEELKSVYAKMVEDHYPLDYLNIDYNIAEANNKISDIVDRLKVLNLEDSLFELKVLMEYFDGVFADLDKEKDNKKTYEEASNDLKAKLKATNDLVNDLFSQIDEIKDLYDLSNDDIKLLNDVKNELEKLNGDYKVLVTHTSNHTFAYSKLIAEITGLSNRLDMIQDRLDNSLDAIGSMKEDEIRARQQLDEIKVILKDAKYKIRDYNFPVIPKNYHVELQEASDAIKEIVKELNKKPIAINTLNTRVDTARDLALKLYTKTKEMVNNAMLAETAIIYGNRYRPLNLELDKALSYAEGLFFKGEYAKSLELSVNSLNKIDSGVYNKIVSKFNNNRM